MKIIIVEDEIRIREGIVNLLGKLGSEYEVLGDAKDGAEGLKLCLEKRPDLVITDIRMPGKDGLEMLADIYAAGLKVKTIVLSAYTEFEYARNAMKLGVTEYLIKPISLMDFSSALDNIKLQIQEEKLKTPSKIGSLDQMIKDIFFEAIDLDDEIRNYIRDTYGIDDSQKVWLSIAYLGNLYEKIDKYKRVLREMFSSYEGAEFILIESPYRKSLIFVATNYKNAKDVEHWLQYRMLQADAEGIVFGCVEAPNLSGMKTSFDSLYKYMEWNIAFEKEVLISYPRITDVQTVICTYPMDAEAGLRQAMCINDIDKINRTVARFHDTFNDGRIYNPREVKECYVRFLWFAMEIAGDLGNLKDGSLDRQELLRRIMNANTKAELKQLTDEVLCAIAAPNKESDTVNDLTVKRAQSLIHEYYNTGITLDEIASKLNITPEYLGTKFRTETGVTFSTYMRDYRMTKAKELLLGTNLKLYEIADKVGYNDAKYFSRVFKEATGMLPAEYRKTK